MSATLWHRFKKISNDRDVAIAIHHGAESVNFAEMIGLSQGWAQLLNIHPGDRVVVTGRNSIALATAIPGIWACGAIPVFVHAEAPDDHIRHAAIQTNASAILLDDGRNMRELGTDLRILPIVRPEPGASLASVPSQAVNDPGSIVFTSGSTGPPKGVVQSAFNLICGVARVAATLGYQETDRILCPIPFAFDYGWGQLLSLLLGGMPLVLPKLRGSADISAAIATSRPTILAGVPAVFAELVSGMSRIREIDRSSIRLITNTGSRIPDPVRQALLDLFPNVDLSLNYGLTETYRSACLPVAQARLHPTSVGFALPGVTLSIVREDGSEAVPDEEGEIVHHGEGRFLYYWNDPQRTAEVLRPDPFWRKSEAEGQAPLVVFTGDLGRKDHDGRLYIHGRRDRQIKSMGVRVSPDEIEHILYASGLVREVAVTSLPNDILGDLIVAVLSLAPDVDSNAVLKLLKSYARKNMSPFMQPRDYVVQSELPRNSNGKVDYPSLKRMVSAFVESPP